ncbi:hypothetical protein R6Q57_017471 [Mikania cordata]
MDKQYFSQPTDNSSKWILSKWRTLKSNNEGSSDHHHGNVGPVTEAVKKRKWAILDDESDNWSNDVLEFYQNDDSTYCYSAVFFTSEKLDKQFWALLVNIRYWKVTRRLERTISFGMNDDFVRSPNELYNNEVVYVCIMMEHLVTGKPINLQLGFKNCCISYRRFMADQM